MLRLTGREIGCLTTMPDVHDVVTVFTGLPHGFVVVAFVRTDVLRFIRRRFRPICYQAVQCIFSQRVVVFIGSRQDQTEGYALPISDDAALCAEFAAVDGAGACELPPKGAGTVAVSTICHSQSIPVRSS